jgi:hypothetical protein
MARGIRPLSLPPKHHHRNIIVLVAAGGAALATFESGRTEQQYSAASLACKSYHRWEMVLG